MLHIIYTFVFSFACAEYRLLNHSDTFMLRLHWKYYAYRFLNIWLFLFYIYSKHNNGGTLACIIKYVLNSINNNRQASDDSARACFTYQVRLSKTRWLYFSTLLDRVRIAPDRLLCAKIRFCCWISTIIKHSLTVVDDLDDSVTDVGQRYTLTWYESV